MREITEIRRDIDSVDTEIVFASQGAVSAQAGYEIAMNKLSSFVEQRDALIEELHQAYGAAPRGPENKDG